jgi:hypothetical protein
MFYSDLNDIDNVLERVMVYLYLKKQRQIERYTNRSIEAKTDSQKNRSPGRK